MAGCRGDGRVLQVKDYYESLRLYHDSKETNEEVYVPLVIAEEIPVAIPYSHTLDSHTITLDNQFIDYQYVETTPI